MEMGMSMTRVRTWTEIVHFSNSDATDYIIVVFPCDSFFCVEYVKRGSYGGFIARHGSRLYDIARNDTRNIAAFIVSVEVCQAKEAYVAEKDRLEEGYGECSLDDEEKQLLLEYGRRLSRVFAEVYSVSAERITYTYTRVDLSVKKVTDNYVVLEARPHQPAERYTARALRLSISVDSCADVEKVKLKHPDDEVAQQVYCKCYRVSRRHSACYAHLKLVTEAPETPLEALFGQPAAAGRHAQQSSTAQQPVLVRGFLVEHVIPSEAILEHSIPEFFKNVKIGKKKIRLATGYFYNWFKYFRTKYYAILNKYAIKIPLEVVHLGSVKRETALYILPFSNAKPFLDEVERLRGELENFQRQLKDFLLHGKRPEGVRSNAKIDVEYVKLVQEYLKEQGVWESVKDKIQRLDLVSKFQVILLPFAVDIGLVAEHLDEEVKKRVERELEAFRRRMAEEAKKRLQERLRSILERLEKLAKAENAQVILEQLRREYQDVEKLASDLGVKLPALEQVKELLEERSAEEALRKIAAKTAKLQRVKALLEEW